MVRPQPVPAPARAEAPDRSARRALVGVLAEAFRDNPMNVAIHGPDPARRLRANRAGLRGLVEDAGPSDRLRVIRWDDRVVAGLVAFPPERARVRRRARLRRWIECFLLQGPAAMRKWDHVAQELMGMAPVFEHAYLAVLGVAPMAQGRGLGSLLLEDLVQALGPAPPPIFLETDRPESERFYRRRGFESIGERRVFGVRCAGLLRPAHAPGAGLCDSVRVAGGATRDVGPRAATRRPDPRRVAPDGEESR